MRLVALLLALAVAACSKDSKESRKSEQAKPDTSDKTTPPAKAGVFHVVITEPAGTREIDVEKDVVNIGRVPSSEVQLTDESVGRMQAMWERREDGTVWLIDLGSLDTRLNGKAVDPTTPETLKSGDVIEVGQSKLVVTF